MFPADLALVPPSTLSVYVHVPFCLRKCGYCDFFSVASIHEAVIDATCRSTLGDLATATALLSSSPETPFIETLYVGGGTPSLLSASKLGQFVSRIIGELPTVPEEITVEMNPESVTADRIDALAEAGVGRLSVGIQSLSAPVLAYLDRNAGVDRTRAALELLSSRFRGELSFDLMCGVPGRAAGEVAGEIAELVSLSPGHLSLYLLTIEELTPLGEAIRRGEREAPDVDEATRSYLEGVTALETAGYEWYEISNFARPGRRCRHNLRYWHMEPYLGVGPGAASTLPGITGPLRIQADHSIPAARYTAETLTTEESLLEHFMMGLRTNEGVSTARIGELFGIDPTRCAAASFRREVDAGRLFIEGDRIVVTRAGRLVLDDILAALSVGLLDCRPRTTSRPH